MTVFHALEDVRTRAMLEYFGGISAPGVTWNWQALPPPELFRRAIGRNRVARSTQAHWVWFTDCDIVFHRDCIDGLASELQGRQDLLAYPKYERITPMLTEDDPVLAAERDRPRVVDIDTSQFTLAANPPKAKGAYHIVHGDAARQCGYCEQVPVYQRPVARWAKTYEDSAFRWLMGTRRRRPRRAGRAPHPPHPQGPLRRQPGCGPRAQQHPPRQGKPAAPMSKDRRQDLDARRRGSKRSPSTAPTSSRCSSRARSRSRSTGRSASTASTPHAKDELYVVIAGTGTFVHGEAALALRAGRCVCSCARESCTASRISAADFATWVFFYGPEGGE